MKSTINIQNNSKLMRLFQRIFGDTSKKINEDKKKLETNINLPLSENKLTVPIIKLGQISSMTYELPDGQVVEIPETSFPFIQQIGQTELSVLIGVDKGGYYEWLQNKDIIDSKEKLIKVAYQNLISNDDISIGLVEEQGLENTKIGILQSTSRLASSYILVESIWDNIFKFCESEDITFVIPTQNSFLFCSSIDKNYNIAELFLIAMTEFLPTQEPITLANSLFTKRKGEPIKLKEQTN